MASTEEQIEEAKQVLRAEFTAQVETLKNELGAMVIEEIGRASLGELQAVSAPQLTEAIAALRDELTATIQQSMPAVVTEVVAPAPVDAGTRKLVTQIHAYVDGLADKLSLPRMEAN